MGRSVFFILSLNLRLEKPMFASSYNYLFSLTETAVSCGPVV